MRNKQGYQIIQQLPNKEQRFNHYYCCYLFWVAVGYYLWKKILHITGYRFHPTDFELLHYYLHNKNLGRHSLVQAIAEVDDICGLEPWELPRYSNIHSGDQVWYFFYRPNYKYRNSKRMNRRTNAGYWKPTGDPRTIMARDPETEIGKKRTLVFYKGRVRDHIKIRTGWVMHEYELSANQTTFILCKLKNKYGTSGVSCIEDGQSSHYLPPNLGEYIEKNTIPAEFARCLTEQADANEILAQLRPLQLQLSNNHESAEAFSYHCGDDPQSSSLEFNSGNHVLENTIPNEQADANEILAQLRPLQLQLSNNHESAEAFSYHCGDDPQSSSLEFNSGNHVLENTIPNERLEPGEVLTEQDQSSTNEQEKEWGNLVTEQNRCNSKNMDLSNLAGKSTDELFEELEALPEQNRFVQGFDDWALPDEDLEAWVNHRSTTIEEQNQCFAIVESQSPHPIANYSSRKRSRGI